MGPNFKYFNECLFNNNLFYVQVDTMQLINVSADIQSTNIQ